MSKCMPFNVSHKFSLCFLVCTMLLALMLGGCAERPDCDQQAVLAEAQGQSGQALDPSPHAECEAAVEQAWQSGLDAFCQPQTGFEAGHRGEAAPELCQQERYLNAYRLGALLHEMQAEQAEIERRIEALSTSEEPQQEDLRALRSRLIVIQRDLPDLITLAQLEGWLPVSAVPDQPE